MPPRSFLSKLSGLVFLSLFPLWVILALKWPISKDVVFYSTALQSFSAEFWNGTWYPRWLTGTNDGYGSPVFVFYAPLPYFVMCAFEWLSSIDPHGFGRLWLGMMIALAISGITCYRWLICVLPEHLAQRGALLYAGFPYLFSVIYTFFGLSQLWAFALFPLLLEAAHHLCQKGLQTLPKWIIAYALLAYTHIISTVIFAAIPLFYVARFSPAHARIRNFALGLLGTTIGLSLAAVYILPALLNRPYIAIEGFTFGNQFYQSTFIEVHSLIATTAILLPLLGFFIELPRSLRPQLFNAPVRFWLGIIAGLYFVTLPISKPLWDTLPAMQFMQGTFRFFMAMLPGVVFIATLWSEHVKTKLLYPVFYVLALATATLYASHTLFFDSDRPIHTMLEHKLIVEPEYQTTWMKRDNIDVRYSISDELISRPAAKIISGTGTADVTSNSARSITLHANISSPESTIELRRFYFPGWQSNSDSVQVKESHAFLAVDVPAGEHEITLTLPWYEGEKMGISISICALIAWLALLYFVPHSKKDAL